MRVYGSGVHNCRFSLGCVTISVSLQSHSFDPSKQLNRTSTWTQWWLVHYSHETLVLDKLWGSYWVADIDVRWKTYWLASRRMTLTPSTVAWVFMGRMWTYCSATLSLLFTRFPVIWAGTYSDSAAPAKARKTWMLHYILLNPLKSPFSIFPKSTSSSKLLWAMTHLASKLMLGRIPHLIQLLLNLHTLTDKLFIYVDYISRIGIVEKKTVLKFQSTPIWTEPLANWYS